LDASRALVAHRVRSGDRGARDGLARDHSHVSDLVGVSALAVSPALELLHGHRHDRAWRQLSPPPVAPRAAVPPPPTAGS
ncbi:MAG TPA: hypothetical protein VN327_12415, partial [Pseudonocardiaceae bacterium]|nr:hypothetical protein [Pseudonocardiaceae bacterium]